MIFRRLLFSDLLRNLIISRDFVASSSLHSLASYFYLLACAFVLTHTTTLNISSTLSFMKYYEQHNVWKSPCLGVFDKISSGYVCDIYDTHTKSAVSSSRIAGNSIIYV